jgi:hypothetical protein
MGLCGGLDDDGGELYMVSGQMGEGVVPHGVHHTQWTRAGACLTQCEHAWGRAG